MSQIQFKPGTFLKFRATTTVHLGPIERDLVKDVEVEFDGVTLKMGGETFSMPTLKGGILGGWLVPVADTQSIYRPQPAGVQVHAADSGNRDRQAVHTAVVSHEEQVVGQVGVRRQPQAPQPTPTRSPQTQAAAQHQASAQVVRGRKQLPSGQIVPAWVDESALPPWPNRRDYPSEKEFSFATDEYNNAVIQQIAYNQQLVKPDSFGGQRHNSADDEGGVRKVGGGKYAVHMMDGQQGDVIGHVRTSSKAAAVGAEGDPQLREWTGRTDRPISIDPMHGEPAGTLIRDDGAIRNLQAEVGATPQWETPQVIVGSAPQAPVIDDGVNPSHMNQARRFPVQSGDDLEVTIDTSIGEAMGSQAVSTPALIPGVVIGNAPQRLDRQAAIQEIVSTWDKSQHWRNRVSEAVDFYADSPDILEAIYAIESPGIVKRIRSEVSKLQG